MGWSWAGVRGGVTEQGEQTPCPRCCLTAQQGSGQREGRAAARGAGLSSQSPPSPGQLPSPPPSSLELPAAWLGSRLLLPWLSTGWGVEGRGGAGVLPNFMLHPKQGGFAASLLDAKAPSEGRDPTLSSGSADLCLLRLTSLWGFLLGPAALTVLGGKSGWLHFCTVVAGWTHSILFFYLDPHLR